MTGDRSRAGFLKSVASAAAFGIPAFFFACDRITPLPKAPPSAAALAPAGDELYVFPHGRLGMTAYEVLRREFPKVSPRDLARLAMATQWLRSKFPPEKAPSLEETTRCVRALFPPKLLPEESTLAAKTAADRFGFPSLDLLRQSLDDAASAWVVEWNPSLAREYGIPIVKP